MKRCSRYQRDILVSRPSKRTLHRAAFSSLLSGLTWKGRPEPSTDRSRRASGEEVPHGRRLPPFALKTTPPKPGLVRESGLSGWGIEVEVWAMPQNEFGSFVAEVPSPLAIGNVTLEDGES